MGPERKEDINFSIFIASLYRVIKTTLSVEYMFVKLQDFFEQRRIESIVGEK